MELVIRAEYVARAERLACEKNRNDSPVVPWTAEDVLRITIIRGLEEMEGYTLSRSQNSDIILSDPNGESLAALDEEVA